MPEAKANEHRSTKGRRLQVRLYFWPSAWLGTMIGCGIFGFVLAEHRYGGEYCLFCAVVGVFIASTLGVPIHLAMAGMGWMTWTSRYRVVLAALAGGLTCAFAICWAFPDADLPFLFGDRVMLLGVGMGTVGGAAGGIFQQVFCEPRSQRRRAEDKSVWQFTLRDLFLRTTILAILLSVSTCCVREFMDSSEQPKWYGEPVPDTVEQPAEESPPESAKAAGDDPLE